MHAMKNLLVVVFILAGICSGFSQTKEVPFTLDDRDRIIQTEQKLESLRNEMNTRFEAQESRTEVLYWGFGIMIALMLFLMGYIIWDRRTALNPIREETYTMKTKNEKLEMALKERAKSDPKLAEILRTFGLL